MSQVAEKWSVKIAAWQRSGVSLAAWCRNNSESYQRAVYWRKHLRKFEHPTPGRFLELHLPSPPLSLECNGVIIQISKGFDRELLADVLSVLRD